MHGEFVTSLDFEMFALLYIRREDGKEVEIRILAVSNEPHSLHKKRTEMQDIALRSGNAIWDVDHDYDNPEQEDWEKTWFMGDCVIGADDDTMDIEKFDGIFFLNDGASFSNTLTLVDPTKS